MIRFIHHILIPVADVERAAAFYGALGMERVPSLGAGIAWMQFGPNQLHLWKADELHTYNGWRHEPSPHFAIEAEELATALSAVVSAGGAVLQEPKTRPHDGSLYAFALDPDGNRFEVTQH